MSNDSPGLDLRQIVVQHHAAVYRYAYRLAGNQPDAEDLTQQTFLVAQQRLDQVKDADRVLGWLFSVLRNCFLKTCRHDRALSQDGVEVDMAQVPEPMPHDEIDQAELQLALDALPDEFRMVVLMFYFEECSYQEIADRLEIPIGTVMSRLARAKGHLRRWLTRRAAKAEATQRPPHSFPGGGLPLAADPRTATPIRIDR
jgi:RNA polymerase sigma-70 factor, ECF subfamily